MSTFVYTAIGRDGRQASGTVAADTRGAAIAQVVRQGMHPLRIAEQGKDGATAAAAAAALTVDKPASSRHAGKRVPAHAVEAFTRELASLLSGGVSLARALSLLKREASNPGAANLWGRVHDDVVGGESLADALAKWPKSFSGVYVAMVRAGEAGGFLDVVLGQIAEFRAREADLKGKVKASLVYPVFLAVLATGVVAFLLAWFIPKFSTIFEELGGNLPSLTVFIIGASHVVKTYGLFLAVGVGVGAYLFRRNLETDAGRRRLDRWVLAAPVLGRVTARFALVRFCRMLGTLVGAGVPIVSSLRVAREAIGSQTLADTVNHAIEEVQRGTALSKSLASSPQLFPPSVVETIAVAEETGRLDKELVRLAGAFESDLDRQLRMLVAIIEPVLLFVMAAVIGTVVVGMLLPIFNLQDMVK
ncbi:MAG: Type IV fimbrial assembly protein PilC [uncultured Phycisphaerae bacterium]|uniref:General secretion pathway protein F n=1 Tax=uncultured Phycisphaerae bacterium TaxID=904963 RepID=A0A6J4NUP0_9BACT|nr:MAG: Type IV fimbrial assembly protein PilC [uncultured Phycisphaerae bacterium]